MYLAEVLSRLVIAYPKHTLAIVLVAVLLGVVATSQAPDVTECRFESTWYAGDQHFNERVEFRDDSSGTWIQGGFDDDAGDQHMDFRWGRTISTLTVVYDRNRRDVRYAIKRRGDVCYLTFQDHPFLSDGSGFLNFADRD